MQSQIVQNLTESELNSEIISTVSDSDSGHISLWIPLIQSVIPTLNQTPKIDDGCLPT